MMSICMLSNIQTAKAQKHPIDLRTPNNIKTVVEFDWRNNRYLVKTMVGDMQIGYTIAMTREEYMSYTERTVRNAYYRNQNRKAYEEWAGEDKGLDLLDMKFSLGPLEKLFGKGGIRVRTQGSASLSMGVKSTKVDNPTLSQKARKQTTFDLEEDIRLNMQASIGEKMNFNLNYNTESTFSFDANQFKLAYQGDEDEIIKHIEAGNVSMTTGSSLIKGGSALFGIKTKLQFGKLNVTALLAKQESSSKTVSSKGGVTKRQFEIMADQYDENRHFFLAQYFRDTYDQNMSKLPLIASGIEITKIEVWVTNKRSAYDNARNILAFEDLGEAEKKGNSHWVSSSSTGLPENDANSLYDEITTQYSSIRNIANVTTTMTALDGFGISGGKDYEKIESARMLNASEYTLNSKLGYLSLKSRLDDDMVLAVAFQYTKGGRTYQVGEFSTDDAGNPDQTLVVKLLKATSGDPSIPLWDLMMKNVYAIGANSLQQTSFNLQIQYMSDTVGVFTNYIKEGPIADQLLLRVMNLDRLNANNESYADGRFDFVEGYTVYASSGRIIFPVVEPFGSHLASKLGNKALADRYCYQELYDYTLTQAQQVAEKNKFRLKGEYTASSGAEINLGAMNVARGSVHVTAGGTTLVENSDYTVDYTMGVVTILNESIIESGTNVSVSLEDQSDYSLQRKTMMGLDAQYDYSKDLTFGATIINLHEKPLTKKVSSGDIPINNTIYGFNLKWNKDFMWLTNAIGNIPWINATAPSNFSITAEYAQLIAGHSDQIGNAGNVYLDDFESSETPSDISNPSVWQIASTPFDDSGTALFPEAALSNNTDYGKNRALFSWYSIDRMFTSQSSNLTPSHIKNDLKQLSDHRVRQVNYDEIYPNKELAYGETGVLNVLNLAFYPQERGPYNVDSEGMGSDGRLLNPEKRWGGMMRSMDVTNFENANYEYIEFWLMDPAITSQWADDHSIAYEGGDLYFNLGEISEDILKDGLKSFENGLDVNEDTTYTATTVWGRVAQRTSTVYAFDNTSPSHKTQDVGLDGLKDDDERNFGTYSNYVELVKEKVDPAVVSQWMSDPFSPVNDPAGDNYHYYRGSDWDEQNKSILERYKHYTGSDGNSPSTADSPEKYSTAAKSTPDVEDINGDNTLNEYERYFQYKVSLRPEDLQEGRNYIACVSETVVPLRNGEKETVKWYQFKIPLREYQKKVGSIQNFKSIRFMRVFMTGWKREQILRLATLELVRSDWRTYTASSLADRGEAVAGTGKLATSTVNIEENAGSGPVNYVLPPGVDRVVDPGQSTSTLLNEQAMAMSVTDLEPHDAVAVYKNSGIDIRRYKNLQLFVHGEALMGNATQLASGDLSVFIRLGADYKDNYYEYEVPLTITPPGTYNNNSPADRLKVWPRESMIDCDLSKLTTLKKHRNTEKQKPHSGISYTTLYTESDQDNPANSMTVVGNPSLSEVTVVMIGVRNKSNDVKSGKVWVNELRMNGIEEEGGWAAKGNATLRISDLATIAASGSYTSAGFGSIEQSSAERQLNNDWEYTVSGQTDIGKWLPEQLKITAPFYYSRAKAVSTPKYDPYNEDMELEETLESFSTKTQRDSIRDMVQTIDKMRSMSLSGVRFNIKSHHPMPWDPANFTMSYSQNLKQSQDPTTQYERDNVYKASFNYNWNPYFKPIKLVGKGSKTKSKLLRDFQLNWLPNSISMSSNWNRSYYEQQLRNVDTYESDYEIPVTYSKKFTWLRQTSISWDITKQLKTNFSSATNSRINEPDAPVNKQLYPDEYEAWKDTVTMQLWKLGTPVDYNQTFDMTWNIPLNKVKATDWITASVKYRSTYQWNRGTMIDEENETGNTLQNSAQWQFDGRLNLENLYNKNKYLKKVNDKFRARKSVASLNAVASRNAAASRVSANKLREEPANAKKSDSKKEIKKDNTFLMYVARVLMMTRSIQVNYKTTDDTYLPSFRPNSGDFFGQGNSEANGLTPGLGFAFGFEGGMDFTEKAIANNWLIVNDSLTTPAVYNRTTDFSYQAVLEPLPGLKINLTGTRRHNERQSHQFMFADLNITRGGSFQQTTMTLGKSIREILLERVDGNPFPGIGQTLPNWNMRYDGLLQIFPKLGDWFKTLTLSHAYNSTYNVGSYQSFPDDTRIEITAASITQNFAPLIGVNATMHSNITAKVEYKKSLAETYNTSTSTISQNTSNDLTIGMGYKIVNLNKRLGWPEGKVRNVSHDLNMKLDITRKMQEARLHRLLTNFSEATSGNRAWTIRFSADYQFSKMLTFKLYYDKQINQPLVSTSYATANSDFGITMSFSLAR